MIAPTNRTKETTTTTGNGSVTLAGAATGFQSFLTALGNVTVSGVPYCIAGGAEWEVGAGTFNGPALTLSRDTVEASSNAGNLVVFSAGTKDVFITNPASVEKPALFEFDVTQSGGNLTFSAPIQNITFRNSSLTSTSPVTLRAAPANVTLPAAGNLGAVTAQSTRILVAEANNAGSAMIVFCNQAGGLPADEEGLLTSVTANASSTAANVWYGASSVANMPYKLVGAVDAVWTTGGTGWGSPTKKVGAGDNALRAMSSLGYGQTWQTVTRTSGTTYYNTTGKPIKLEIVASAATTGIVVIGGYTFTTFGGGGITVGYGPFEIPPGVAYSYTQTGGSYTAAELR